MEEPAATSTGHPPGGVAGGQDGTNSTPVIPDSTQMPDMNIRVVPMEAFFCACALSAVGFLFTTCYVIFNIRYRDVRLVRMSSPNINLLLSAGAYLAYIACLLSTLEALQHAGNMTVAPCQAINWILPVAFTLTFGAMFSKSWRVRRIFLRAPHKKVVVKDHILFAIVLALLAGDILLLTFWQAFDPLKVTKVMETVQYEAARDTTSVGRQVELESGVVVMCRSRHGVTWPAAIVTYKLVLLLLGVYMSWAVRAVTLPAMNDSTAILLSSLLTTILGAATAAMSVWFRFRPDVTSPLVMAVIWVCTTVTLFLNFVPKIRLVWHDSEDDMVRVSMASQVIYSPNQSIDQVEDEIYHLVAENRGLKKSLTQKEQKIKALQDHVTSAKEKLENLFVEEKQDSGLDPDLSSSSNQDDDASPASATATVAAPVSSRRRDSADSGQPEDNHSFGIYLKRSDDGRGSRSDSRSGSKLGSRAESRSSLRSLTQAWARMSWGRGHRKKEEGDFRWNGHRRLERNRLRTSLGDLAHELQTVNTLSSSLRDALREDLSRARARHSFVYDQVRAHQDLAGSIVDSYHLEDGSDSYSYVSSRLAPPPIVPSTASPQAPYPLRYAAAQIDDSASRFADERLTQSDLTDCLRRTPSTDSLSTIGNDRYYPSSTASAATTTGGGPRYHRRPRGAAGRAGAGWRRPVRPKIFTVFGPRPPPPVQSVETRNVDIVYDEGTYV